jgi:hypothetical protein
MLFLPVYTRPHILRLTDAYGSAYDEARHVMDQTLEGYRHLAAPNAARVAVRSPIKDLSYYANTVI